MVRKRGRYKLTVAEAIQVITEATKKKPQKSTLTPMNVVVKVTFSEPLDLASAATVYGGPYSNQVFPAPSPRSLSPLCTMLLFCGGSAICIGTNNVPDAVLAVHQLASSLARDQYSRAKILNLKLHNLAGIFSLGFYVDLSKLMRTHRDKCWYEPKMFGGLTYTPEGRSKSPPPGTAKTNRMSFIIFYTGRCVITGGSSVADMQRAVDACMPLLESLKVTQKEATRSFLELLEPIQVIKRGQKLLDKAAESHTSRRARAKARQEKARRARAVREKAKRTQAIREEKKHQTGRTRKSYKSRGSPAVSEKRVRPSSSPGSPVPGPE